VVFLGSVGTSNGQTYHLSPVSGNVRNVWFMSEAGWAISGPGVLSALLWFLFMWVFHLGVVTLHRLCDCVELRRVGTNLGIYFSLLCVGSFGFSLAVLWLLVVC